MKRMVLMLVMAIVGVWIALALGGCAGPQLLKGSGVPAAAPGGFVDYCNRHPERAECGGAQ